MEEYIKNIDLQTVSMQTLAFIGDAVYNLYKKSIHYVSAKSQSRTIDAIMESLTEKEIEIYKRGRNTNIITSKHADTIEYKKSTGFETLLGFLYISKQNERLEEIIQLCIKEVNKD